MITPIPVSRYLVPEPLQGIGGLPAGFTLLDETITGGFPHRALLEAGLTVTLVLPSGLAREWMRADGHGIVASSSEETLLDDSEARRAARLAAPRLIVRDAGGIVVGVVPLSVGVVRAVGDSGTGIGVVVEIVILAFDLRAGSVRGPGDWGGRIALGWRRAEKGTDNFEAPPLNPYVLPRLARSHESLVGTSIPAARLTGSAGDNRLARARKQWRDRRISPRRREL